MAQVTAAQVKELRERTQLGMMDCKKALVEAEGDIELAIEELRKSSGMKAAKKASRTARDGLIALKIAEDGTTGVIVEVNCETDFAARDENFGNFVSHVAEIVFAQETVDLQGLLASGLDQTREALVQKIGENISVRRAEKFSGDNILGNYVHTNGKIGVLVDITGGDDALKRDIAMHIAASSPLVVSADQMPEELVAKEREIYTAQAQESKKPPEIIEKMIDGKIRKYLAENSLFDQPFVKDSDMKIGKLLEQAGATVVRFVRLEVGEGIEVEDVDFAAEVAAQLGDG